MQQTAPATGNEYDDTRTSMRLAIQMRQEDGTLTCLRITEMTVDHIALDANHRLAGKDLILQLDLLAILDRTDSSTRAKPAPAA